MITLYVRLLPRAVNEQFPHWQAQTVPFALSARDGKLQRSGIAPLQDLAPQIAHAQRVVILLAASDVTLLRIAVPPLSASRLQAALPALVEEKLITDPADCVLVAGPEAGGLRTIAVVERDWLQSVVSALSALGARRVAVLPLQLCLPLPASAGVVAAAVTEALDQIDLAVRFSDVEGMGVPISPTRAETSALELCQALLALVAHHPFELSVPAGRLDVYAQAVQTLDSHDVDITLREENWQQWIDGALHQTMDLVKGLTDGQRSGPDWSRWRWPLALAALLLIVQVSALNWDWWRMRNEASDLRAGMTRIYRNAFPNDSVIVDPLAQMKQKLDQVRRASGGLAPDDFIPLAATFGDAWRALPASGETHATSARGSSADSSASPTVNATSQSRMTAPPIASLDYRDGALTVRFKPGANPPTEAAKVELSARNARLTDLPEQGDGVVWQIRSAR